MKSKKILSLLMVSLCIVGMFGGCGTPKNTTDTTNTSNVEVLCENGKLIGETESETNVQSFKGIPYAKAPVGDLRWKAPQELDETEEEVNATDYGKSCMQYEWPSERASYNEQGEDCLTLNVWTKDTETKNKPVMVFFHGGGYAWGGTSDPIYDGQYFVEENEDIVMITCNYRIGMMGYIDLSNVEGGEDYSDSTQLGLLDQIQALKWVQKNVEAFGGDPNNVTIFGESCGAGAVSTLLAMPETEGLFNKCIAESGSVQMTYSNEDYDSRQMTEKLLEITGAKNMEELIAIPEKELMDIYTNYELDEDGTTLNDLYNMPLRDGKLVPKDLYKSIADGANKDVTLLVGSNANEWNYWIEEMDQKDIEVAKEMYEETTVDPKIDSMVDIATPEEKESIDKFLDLQEDKSELMGKTELLNDMVFRVPSLVSAANHSKAGGTSYVYYFGKESTNEEMGSCHASELAYVFNNPKETIFSGEVDKDLAKNMSDMWANFARTGNPSTEKINWTPYNVETRDTLVIDNDSSMRIEEDYLGKQRELIEPLLKYGNIFNVF